MFCLNEKDDIDFWTAFFFCSRKRHYKQMTCILRLFEFGLIYSFFVCFVDMVKKNVVELLLHRMSLLIQKLSNRCKQPIDLIWWFIFMWCIYIRFFAYSRWFSPSLFVLCDAIEIWAHSHIPHIYWHAI